MRLGHGSTMVLALAASLPGCLQDETVHDRSEALRAREVLMPVHADAVPTADSCTNSPGPYVTLEGEIVLGGLGARIIFRNNVQGTHENIQDVLSDVVLIPAGESITIPKPPSRGGAGGNPFIWVQFLDGEGDPVSDEIFLGRCVQGLGVVDADLAISALADFAVTAGDCSNSPGPFITLEGEVALAGLSVQFIFRNNDNPVGGPHETNVVRSAAIVIIPAGESIEIPKQPVLGGAGGNPRIYLQFIDGDGDALSDEIYLGRCVQL